MAKTALVIGGSGQIGQATARRLLADGWTVLAAQKNPGGVPAELVSMGARPIALDRGNAGAVARAVGGGVDALIDTVAFDDTHGRQLLEIAGSVGAMVVISSASVYCDEAGRTLDEAATNGFPRLPEPIGEDQPTVAPSDATYSTRKSALEQTLLQSASIPVTILRCCAIHGPGSRHPREWFFVRRILDGRRQVPLAWNGASRFHTSATANIAELIAVCLAAPATRVLNAADPEALTVMAIGEAIAAVYGHDLKLVAFQGPPSGGVGAHPWCVPRAVVVDMSRAGELGYRPVVHYRDAVAAACRSAEAAAAAGVVFPEYLTAMFDYVAEDAFLASRDG
ncbi:MAG TPA: NAD-dependent epimerase/dehydratase family protein [Caulobacteraceae bacterium]